jgi:uncharacterized membrane protein
MSLPLPTFTPDHIHPILVNFTAALVPASVASDILGRLLRKPSLHSAAWWMLLYAALISPLTGLAGLWWKKEAGPTLPHGLLLRHQYLGIALVLGLIVLALWRWRMYRNSLPPGVIYLAAGVMAVFALIFQGTLGGAMLFGS